MSHIKSNEIIINGNEPQIMSKAQSVTKGTMLKPSGLAAAATRNFSTRMRVLPHITGTNCSKMLKWNAGVSNLRRECHFSPETYKEYNPTSHG